MPLTMGVDIVERSSRTKATKKRMVKGVAGRSIVKDDQVDLRGDTVEVSWCLCASMGFEGRRLREPVRAPCERIGDCALGMNLSNILPMCPASHGGMNAFAFGR